MEKTKRLTVEKGISVAYRLWCSSERQQRPLLVLLHGLASNMTRWSEFVEYTTVKDSWDILRLDLRGHGESMCRCPLNMEVWSEDLLRILDAEQRSKAVLVGHSLGAQVAVYFANHYPERVNGLVLIEPILGQAFTGKLRLVTRFAPVLRFIIAVIRMLNSLGLRRRHIPLRDHRALDQGMRETLLADGLHEEMVRKYSSPWPNWKHFPTANYIEEVLEMLRALPPFSDLTPPVLVILGKGETFYDPQAIQQAIAHLNNAKVIYVDAYHWPLTEKPEDVRRAVEDWCAQLANGESLLP